MKTLTCCDVAATDEIKMCAVNFPLRVSMYPMFVMRDCVYPAILISRQPIDSNTARVKFTRFLAICQCVGS